MRAQRLIRAILIARFDHFHDAVMFGLRDLTTPLHRKRRGRHQGHGAVHKVKLLHQIAVVRRQMNLFVKPPIGPRQS